MALDNKPLGNFVTSISVYGLLRKLDEKSLRLKCNRDRRTSKMKFAYFETIRLFRAKYRTVRTVCESQINELCFKTGLIRATVVCISNLNINRNLVHSKFFRLLFQTRKKRRLNSCRIWILDNYTTLQPCRCTSSLRWHLYFIWFFLFRPSTPRPRTVIAVIVSFRRDRSSPPPY